MDVLGLVMLLAVGLVVLVAALVVHSLWMLTHPPRRTYSWAVVRNLPGDPREASPGGGGGGAQREVRFVEGRFGGAGGSAGLPYWDIEGFEPAGPVVIVTHGWGDSRVTMLPRLEPLVRAARRVIIWEMPGHGEAAGVCRLGAREVGLLRELIGRVVEEEQGGTALRAVMNGQREQEDTARSAVPPGIVLYGFSLGAGLSIAGAAREETERWRDGETKWGNVAGRVAGVIAEAPYRTPIEPAWNLAKALQLPHRVNLPVAMTILGLLFAGDWRWGRRKPERVSGFDRATLAASVRVPLLVLNGSDDVICEPASGRAIAEAAPLGRFVQIDGGGHNDLWIVPERRAVMMREVMGFLRQFSSADLSRDRKGAEDEQGCTSRQ